MWIANPDCTSLLQCTGTIVDSSDLPRLSHGGNISAEPECGRRTKPCFQGGSSAWAAERVRQEAPFAELFDAVGRANAGSPVLFTGEMIFPWMFDEVWPCTSPHGVEPAGSQILPHNVNCVCACCLLS